MVDFLDPSAPSLPRMLHNAGYATAHIGKWHLGGGRDVIDAPKFAAYGYDVGLGTYESPEPASALGLKTVPWGPADQREEQQVPRHERSHWMIDQTLAFMQSHREQPCFVNLWLDDTHTPFVPSQEQIERVRVNGDGERKTNYKAVLANLDKEIGRLLSGLASTNTLVLFLGDNGASPPFERERSAGLRGQKLSLYEGGTRIPFITWWSAKKMPKIVNETSVVSSIDLLPSLASLCQAKLPQNYVSDGEDMSMAFRGAQQRRSKPLHWEYGRNNTSFVYPMDEKHRSPNLALRDGNWKLLINADGTGAELYDLKKDPNETTNLSNEQSALTHELSSKALAWRKSLP